MTTPSLISLSVASQSLVLIILHISGCGSRQSPAEERYDALLQEGRALARQGKLREATEAFSDAVYADPEEPEGHFFLAKAYSELGRHYRALDELRLAERLRPEHGPQKVLLGRALTKLGQLDEAREVLGAAVERWPESAQAQLAIGLVNLRQDRVAEAEMRLTTALSLDPRLDEAHEALGRAKVRLGRAEQAITHFREAARVSSCDDLALGGLGAALVVAGHAAEGLDSFEEAARCAADGRDAPWRAGMALASAAEGQPAQALEALQESGSFFRSEVQQALASRLEAPFDCQAEETICRQAEERLWAGALLLFVLGAADAAQRELEASLELFDGDAMTHWVLAETFSDLGRGDDALIELDRAGAWEPSEAIAQAMAVLRTRLVEGEP